MSEPRSDGYLMLAVCIATAAVGATIVQAVDFLGEIDADAFTTWSIVGGVFSKISLAMAMLCTVIIGRHMVAATAAQQASAAEHPRDTPVA